MAVTSASARALSILPEVRKLQEQIDLDMKNGGVTQADYAQLAQLKDDINCVLATSPDADDAYFLNQFLDAVDQPDPFQNLDVAANNLENDAALQTQLGGGSILLSSGGNGAPALTIPPDPGLMQIWLSQLLSQNSQAAAEGDESAIQESGSIQEDVNKRALAQIQEAQQNAQNAADAQKTASIEAWCSASFELLGAILGEVGAVLASVATAGAATPLVVVSTIGLVMAIDNFTNTALQQEGVQVTGVDGQSEPIDITLGGLVRAVVEQQEKDGTIAIAPATAKPGGITFPDQASLDKYVTGWTVAATMLVAIALAAGGGAGGAADATEEAAETTADAALRLTKSIVTRASADAETSQRVVGMASTASDVAGSGTSIAQGVNQLNVAKYQESSTEETAEQKMLQSISDYLSSYIKTQSEDAKSKLKMISRIQASASQTMENIAQTLIEVAHQDA